MEVITESAGFNRQDLEVKDTCSGSAICDAFHNRARTRDLGATYTEGPFSYLSAVGRDYEAYRLCL